jgi:hypothetical protein
VHPKTRSNELHTLPRRAIDHSHAPRFAAVNPDYLDHGLPLAIVRLTSGHLERMVWK